jgi:uncharacterized protein (TIRG00374 family)
MSARLGARIAIGIAMSVLACALLVQAVDLPATAARLGAIDPVWLAIPLAGLAGQLIIRARRWALLVSSAAGTTVRTGRVVGPLAVGYLANAVLPARLGEVARAVLLAQREHLAIGAVAASVVVERVVDLVALLSLGIVSTGTVSAVGWPAVGATVALVAGLGSLVYLAPALSRRVPGRLPGRLREAAVHFLVGVAGVRARTSLAAFALSALAWLGDVLLVWACARAIGVDLALPAAVAIAVGAALGTALPAASGYLGTYELGAVALGSFAGVPPDTVLAVAVLAHVFAVLPMALVGVAAVARMGVRFEVPGRGQPAAVARAEARRP